MKKLPKAELHVHLDGTMTPSLALQLAAEKSIELDEKIFSADKKRFVWKDVPGFHKIFAEFSRVMCTARDYELLTYTYLETLAAQNGLYAELIVAPFHAEQNNLSYEQMLAGMVEGINKAHKAFGIEARILPAFIRIFGPAVAERHLDQVLSNLHPYVVGVNLVGGIEHYEVKDFEKVFSRARAKNLRASCHAGEVGGPEEIWQAIRYLGVERISHGVACVKDEKLVETLIDKKITLEICPTSNVCLKVCQSYEDHPLKKIKDAGVLLTLNTDDPGFFNVDLTHEYQVAQDHFGFSKEDLLTCSRQAIQAGFMDEKLKRALMGF